MLQTSDMFTKIDVMSCANITRVPQTDLLKVSLVPMRVDMCIDITYSNINITYSAELCQTKRRKNKTGIIFPEDTMHGVGGSICTIIRDVSRLLILWVVFCVCRIACSARLRDFFFFFFWLGMYSFLTKYKQGKIRQIRSKGTSRLLSFFAT